MCHSLGDGQGGDCSGVPGSSKTAEERQPHIARQPGTAEGGPVRTRASLLALEWKGRQELKVQGQGGWDGQN